MKEERITLNEELARQILKKNVGNRDVRTSVVNKFVSIIKNDRWNPASSFLIGKDGILKDGQHRLLSIIKTKAEVPAILVKGCPNDMFAHVDTTAARSSVDIYTIKLKELKLVDKNAKLTCSVASNYNELSGNSRSSQMDTVGVALKHQKLIWSLLDGALDGVNVLKKPCHPAIIATLLEFELKYGLGMEVAKPFYRGFFEGKRKTTMEICGTNLRKDIELMQKNRHVKGYKAKFFYEKIRSDAFDVLAKKY